MNQVKRYYIIELIVDEDHEGAPDHDEVCLHIENELLQNTDEFGISNATCAHWEDPKDLPSALELRRRSFEEGNRHDPDEWEVDAMIAERAEREGR